MHQATKAITNGIQMGHKTHHHDHEISLVSLRTINTIQSNPKKPIPPDELLLFAIKICFKGLILIFILVLSFILKYVHYLSLVHTSDGVVYHGSTHHLINVLSGVL